MWRGSPAEFSLTLSLSKAQHGCCQRSPEMFYTAQVLPAARSQEHPNFTFPSRESLDPSEKPGWSQEQTLNLRVRRTTKPSSTEGMNNCIFMVLATHPSVKYLLWEVWIGNGGFYIRLELSLHARGGFQRVPAEIFFANKSNKDRWDFFLLLQDQSQ